MPTLPLEEIEEAQNSILQTQSLQEASVADTVAFKEVELVSASPRVEAATTTVHTSSKPQTQGQEYFAKQPVQF